MTKNRSNVLAIGALLSCAGAAVAGAPSNDACGSASPIAIGVHNFTTAGATTDTTQGSCESTFPAINDIFYTFVAPEDASYEFSAMLAEYTPVISLYTNCASSTYSQCGWSGSGAFGVSGSRVARFMETGETIIVRIGVPDILGPNPVLNGLFTVLPNTTPANDTCSAALNVGVGSTEFDTTGCFADEIWGCGATVQDIFFRFTPAQSGRYDITTCGTLFDSALSAAYGCGSSIIACNINTFVCPAIPNVAGSVRYPSAIQLDLHAGEPVYLRVAGYGQGSERGYGKLNISLNQAFTTPANDTCAAASVISTGQTIQIESLGAAGPDGTSSCGNLPVSPDVWFRYTPNFTGYAKFDTCGGTAVSDTVLSIHPGNCSAGASACNNDGCYAGASEIITSVTSGTTYYVRVGMDIAGLASDGIVNTGSSLRVTQIGQPPANDVCANAVALTPGQPVNFDSTNASTEIAPVTGWPQIKDLWYTASAPGNGVLSLSLQVPSGSTLSNPMIEVLNACGGSSISRNYASFPNPYSLSICNQSGPQNLRIRVGNSPGSQFSPGSGGTGVLTLGSFVPATGYTQPPAGFVTENEPCQTRVDTNVDTTNRGTSGLFSPVTCGVAMAATLPRGGQVYDYDYFTFNTGAPRTVLFMGSIEAASTLVVYSSSFEYQWNLVTTSACVKTFTATINLLDEEGIGNNYYMTIQPVDQPQPSLCAADENYWFQYFIVNDGSVTINTQPTNKFAQLGGSATFNVAASGSNLKYQWRRGDVPLSNGGSVSGATSAALTVSNISAADLGSYNVVVTSGCGAAISNAVNLAIGNACPADFNGDSTRDVSDLFAYINAWLAKTANADFNNSGNVDVADLFAYINAWLAGC